MHVRIPAFDFSNSPAIWAPANPGFAHKYDGASLLLPYLEPYLIRVMRQAQQTLADQGRCSPALAEQVRIFNQQEGQHYQLHSAYNDYLKQHYDGLDAFEEEIKADFERMLAEESLQWNLAYSVGFETIGPIQTPLWFDTAASEREGADPMVDALWSWHLAEEFEHRCVAFDLYQQLYGSWRERLKLFFYQNRHLEQFTDRVAIHMLRQDAAAGRLELQPSIEQSQAFRRRFERHARPKVLAVLMPWHNPARAKIPAQAATVLANT